MRRIFLFLISRGKLHHNNTRRPALDAAYMPPAGVELLAETKGETNDLFEHGRPFLLATSRGEKLRSRQALAKGEGWKLNRGEGASHHTAARIGLNRSGLSMKEGNGVHRPAPSSRKNHFLTRPAPG